MEGDDVEDPLKNIEQVLEPDERQKYFVGDLGDNHAALAVIRLKPAVPVEVRQLFETAKNVSLYSWFVYRFHPIAELVGFTALEAALLKKCEMEGITEYATRSPGLKKLLVLAVEKAWLTEEGIPDRMDIARARVRQRKIQEAIARNIDEVAEPTDEEIAEEEKRMKILPGICDAGPKIRNDLAHGSPILHPNSTHGLKSTSRLINQLF